ncbi:MAG: O-antigen ligase family protein [Proteobacteria bacterium]|nr:O-antigen ligase family protein [Pseudomonadota bacterium]
MTALITKGMIVKTDISNIWEYSTIIVLPLFLPFSARLKEKIIMTLFVFSSLVALLGLIQHINPSIVYPFPRQLVSGRIHGFFSHGLHYSGFESIIVIMALSLILFAKLDRRMKLCLWGVLALNASALLLSLSRSYYISVAIIILAILLIKKTRYFLLGCAVLISLLFLILSFPNPLNSRIQTLLDSDFQSNKERIYIWKTSVRMASDHPLVGVGAGNWGEKAAEHYFPLIEKETGYKLTGHGHAHNTYLTWLSESGIPGLLLFLTFWSLVVRRLFYVKSTVPKGSFDYALIVGTLGGLGNLFIAGMFEHNFGTSVILLLISFLIGLSLKPSEEITVNESC